MGSLGEGRLSDDGASPVGDGGRATSALEPTRFFAPPSSSGRPSGFMKLGRVKDMVSKPPRPRGARPAATESERMSGSVLQKLPKHKRLQIARILNMYSRGYF